MLHRSLTLLVLCSLTSAALGQLSVSSVTPNAIAPGKTTELLVNGANLTDPLAIWTSFPAKVEVEAGQPTQRKIKLTLEASVSVGLGGIVIANPGGVSPPWMVMIDDLATAVETANNTPMTAQEVAPPIAVDGVCNGQQSDFYKLILAQGQKISLEVVAARIGSDFDSILRVLDANGRELALVDDDPALGADARFSFTAPAAGQYLIELRDNRFKAGGRYRLRIGDFPLVATAFPAGGKVGLPLTTTLIASDGESIPASLQITRLGEIFTSGKRAGGAPSGFSLLRSSELNEVVAPDQIEKPEEGTTIATESVINGRLAQPKERDRFSFAAKKGERWNFQAATRSLGSPAILSMRVLNAANAQLAATAPTEGEEELLSFTAAEDGVFRLELEDLLGRGGPTFVYRIEVTQGPQFGLVIKNDPNTRFQHLMAPGNAQFADVQVQRNGYTGAIELSPLSTRAGFRLWPASIGENVNELRVYLFPPADFHAGELVDLRIQGKANVGPRELKAVAHNRLQLKTARPILPHPPGWQEGTIYVGHADQAAFYTVAPAMAELPVALGAQAMLPFAFERTDANFKDVPLTLLVTGLPAGVTTEVKRNGAGPKESYEVTFKAAATSPEGKHVVHWFGYAEYGGRGRAIEGDITLVLAKPAQ